MRNLLPVFFVAFIFFGGYWVAGDAVKNGITSQLLSMRLGIVHSLESISLAWDCYIGQANAVVQLTKEKENLTRQNLFLEQQYNTLLPLKAIIPTGFIATPAIQVAHVLSYSALPGFTRMWLDIKSTKSDKIYGAVIPSPDGKEMISVGIAVWSDARLQLLLNSDPQCTYAVSVGNTNAPGIAMGRNDKLITVRYIPYWMNIKVGDEVITSGLDSIYSYGVRVGKVKKILGDSAYKEALVEPYFYSLTPKYVYLLSAQEGIKTP